MNLAGLLALIQTQPGYRDLLDRLTRQTRTGRGPALGVVKSARPYVLAAVAQHVGRPLVVVVGHTASATQMYAQLRQWLAPSRVFLFAEADPLPYEKVTWSVETTLQRLNALAALAPYFAGPLTRKEAGGSETPVVIAPARSLLSLTIPRREFLLGLRSLRQGQQLSLAKLLETWTEIGYRSVEVVEEPGSFSRRGGIIDLFPPNERWPIRIELFGDEIDSMRQFDPSTQRSIQQVSTVLVAPASEGLPKYGPAAATKLAQLDFSACHPIAESDFRQDMAHLEARSTVRGMEFYLQYLYSQPGRLLDFLPEHGILAAEDLTELDSAARELEEQAEESRQIGVRSGDLPADFGRAIWRWEEIRAELEQRLDLELGHGRVGETPADGEQPLSEVFMHAPRYGGRLKQIVADGSQLSRAGERIVIVSRQTRRLVELFQDAGRPIAELEQIDALPEPGSISVVRGLLNEGWVLTDGTSEAVNSTVLLTDTELFGWSKPAGPQQRKSRGLSPESFFADVAPGDFVVHIEHGIGIYRGLVKLPLDGVEREYIQIDYAAGDRLYLPINQADRLARYVGAGESGPALNRLGTTDWETIKQRTRRAIHDIAKELLALYAARSGVAGYAFQPDTPWQLEMEEAFPYVETPDQLTALEEVKADMEQSRPMDRLICGDVGYGKTEIALRSAFKAVMDGKQVAVLVPTTVLAQQHYKRFQERLSAFPVQVEMLSRFRSEKDQDRILSELGAGKIDIIIGTHRLVQKDVQFKDLGLVIIDEEQRFGVVHKERLKQLRNEVDVLTLSATPIPRTLYMSLSGVRDMSTIETPPEERLPIKTVLAEFDETLVRQAIVRELERDGQVYFVHNRVQGIEILARRLQKIVPEANFAVAHGQMPEKELAQVMWDFANGEFDVLVCTTIIESGIDIPNVNTIIINQADHFGLSQLYQLRGRVGRSAVRAYAYLLYDKHTPLSEIARRRLEAIMEANELGAGFRIAMEDLEIRGAGDILGERQHGHIAAVGLDMYSRMLAQAVRELREGKTEPPPAESNGWRKPPAPDIPIGADQPLPLIDLPLAAYVPTAYVSEESLRLQLYRRLAALTTQEEIEEMAAELRDRFGALPEQVENLLYQLRIKATTLQLGLPAIVREDGQIVIRAPALERMNRDALQMKLGSRARVARRQIWLPADDEQAWKSALPQILAELAVAGG